jgi:hypothetical protein
LRDVKCSEPTGNIQQAGTDPQHGAPGLERVYERKQDEREGRDGYESGQQPADATYVEVSEAEAPRVGHLLEEKSRDEEAAKSEEDVDADPASAGKRDLRVYGDHGAHGEGSHAV